MTGTSLEAVLLLLRPFPFFVSSDLIAGILLASPTPCKLWSSMLCGCHGNWAPISSLLPISHLFLVFQIWTSLSRPFALLAFYTHKDQCRQALHLFSSIWPSWKHTVLVLQTSWVYEALESPCLLVKVVTAIRVTCGSHECFCGGC